MPVVAAHALFAEVEPKNPAYPDALVGPAQPDTTERNRLVEELQLPLPTRGVANAGRDLPRAGAVQPEPDQQRYQQDAGDGTHSGYPT